LVFDGPRCVEFGPVDTALSTLKSRFDSGTAGGLLIFEAETGKQVDFDLRGTLSDVLNRVSPQAPKAGPGRPKLGVVGREVSLLPSQWKWLEGQPGGASAAIRKLVDAARKTGPDAKETTYRFMTVLAGNLPGYEEALRALFAADRIRFEQQTSEWPVDVRTHVLRLATGAWK
jgi:hypothetical protein